MEGQQIEATTEKKQKESDVSSWMIAFGVGVTITAAAATTVYVIQSRRNAELHALKFGKDDVIPSVNKDFVSKYCNMTVNAFSVAKKFMTNYLAPTTEQPMTNSNAKSPVTNTFTSDQEGEL